MIEKQMWNSLGKQVKIICVSGRIFEGRVSGWTSAEDNEADEDRAESSIDLRREGVSGLTCLYASEIKSIEILN